MSQDTFDITIEQHGAHSAAELASPDDANNANDGNAKEEEMGLGSKIVIGVIASFCLCIGGFVFFRTVIQDCGCPERYYDGRRLQNAHSGSDCGCIGGVFDCYYKCGEDGEDGDGRTVYSECFSHGELVSCEDEESR